MAARNQANDMTIRTILRFPDPRLRAMAAPVDVFDAELSALAGDLLETMRAAPGIGITAPHVGILLRLVVIELTNVGGAQTYVNPQIVWSSEDRLRHPEGSVSMPGLAEEIERPARIRLSYQDLGGIERTEEASGLLSVCLQHEIDQLDGIFWIHRLSRLKRDRLIKRFDRQRGSA
jgi:peptide deformylase